MTIFFSNYRGGVLKINLESKTFFQATVVTEEEVLALSGGGDWHTAYICIFETKKLPIFSSELENDQMENMETN